MAITLRIDSVSGGADQFQILYSFNGGPTVGRLFSGRADAVKFARDNLDFEEAILAMVIAFWAGRDANLVTISNVLGKTLTLDWSLAPSQIIKVV